MSYQTPISLAAVLLCSHVTVFGQVAVYPSFPKEQETVRVQLPTGALGFAANGSADTYDPRGTTLVMTANKIVVSLLMVGGDGLPRAGSPAFEWPLGQLPPGSYEVEVTKRSASGVNQGLVGRTSFVVAPRAANDATYNVTDLYWNPNEPGWGVSVTRLASGGLVLIWFVYENDNRPTWYFLSNGEWRTPQSFRGTLYRSTGSNFSGQYDPARFQATPVGSAEFSFNALDYDFGGLLFTIDGVTYLKSLRRQRL